MFGLNGAFSVRAAVGRFSYAATAAVFMMTIISAVIIVSPRSVSAEPGIVTVIDTLEPYATWPRPFEDNIGWATDGRQLAQMFQTGDTTGNVDTLILQDYYLNSAHDSFDVKIYGANQDNTIDEGFVVASFNSSSVQAPNEQVGGNAVTFRQLDPADQYLLLPNTKYWLVVTLTTSSKDFIWRQSNVDNNSGEGTVGPSRALKTSDGSFIYNTDGESYHPTYSNTDFHFNFYLSIETLPDYTPEVATDTVTSVTKNTATLNGSVSGGADMSSAIYVKRGFDYGTTNEYDLHVEDENYEGLSGGDFSRTVAGLTCGTTYYARAFTTVALLPGDAEDEFTGYGDEVAFTTQVCDEMPNDDTDANGDGIADIEQAHVSSATNSRTGKVVAIETSSACEVSELTVVKEASNNVKDSSFNYEQDFINFSADCGTNGYTATVKAYFYGVASDGLIARKYNPSTGAYYTVPGAVLSQRTIGNEWVTVVTFQITDGGDMDADGVGNGVIIDPIGLGNQVVAAPNTGLGGRLY